MTRIHDPDIRTDDRTVVESDSGAGAGVLVGVVVVALLALLVLFGVFINNRGPATAPNNAPDVTTPKSNSPDNVNPAGQIPGGINPPLPGDLRPGTTP